MRYSGRIAALDVARGLAVLGMFIAHVGPDREGLSGWLLAVADGRSSILFATLAGVSLAILSGRNMPYTGVEFLQAKIRIFTRAAMLLVISGVLALMNDIVALILTYYATWFILAIPFLHWRPRNLFILAGLSWVIGPILASYLEFFFAKAGMHPMGDSSGFMVDTMVTGAYVGLIYMGFVFAGLAIGRLDLTDRSVGSMLAPIGASLAVLGYGVAYILTQAGYGQEDSGYPKYFYGDYGDLGWRGDGMGLEWDPYATPPGLEPFLGAEPHSSTVFEAIGSGGFSIAVIGFLLLGGPILGKVLYPVAAVGSMSLSAYSFHIIAIWFIPALVFPDSFTPMVWLLVAALVLCTLWRMLFGRGPLERLLYTVSVRAARICPPPNTQQPAPAIGEYPPR